jgi:hypothetical protein
MSDSNSKSTEEKTGKHSGGMRLSVIRHGFPNYTSRQIQWWVEASNKIPAQRSELTGWLIQAASWHPHPGLGSRCRSELSLPPQYGLSHGQTSFIFS